MSSPSLYNHKYANTQTMELFDSLPEGVRKFIAEGSPISGSELCQLAFLSESTAIKWLQDEKRRWDKMYEIK